MEIQDERRDARKLMRREIGGVSGEIQLLEEGGQVEEVRFCYTSLP